MEKPELALWAPPIPPNILSSCVISNSLSSWSFCRLRVGKLMYTLSQHVKCLLVPL
ncbi:hypothetical protein BP00DRAFT_52247 [Aspergillus indologenus CBS 114.80]|uniref:Uncharacterized protein n=1 Tax=Aspergillus indologenus CBS 114.80 TaxID=1450541 RepID=A0A2V5HQB4_9EURO|nr:hypothetical protein BP00DRAFT_52247 [Aspergillus indologenus CBS 114.80]